MMKSLGPEMVTVKTAFKTFGQTWRLQFPEGGSDAWGGDSASADTLAVPANGVAPGGFEVVRQHTEAGSASRFDVAVAICGPRIRVVDDKGLLAL